MQLGFVSAILPDLDLEHVLDFAQRSGFDCVELMCWPPGKAERRYAGVTHVEVQPPQPVPHRRYARIVAGGVPR